MKPVWLSLLLLLAAGRAVSQEINFSRVQDMALWYNPSLKTDKLSSVKLNYRNVNFQGMIAYNSTSAMLDLPILSRAAREKANSGFMNVSIAVASDKSNQGILNNTLGAASFSYAVPLGGDETYLAAGIQGGYYSSRLKTGGELEFGDQFDKFGPIEGASSSDRLAGGWSYGYLNVNSGVSLFGNGKHNKWHLGLALQNVNKPYTDKIRSDLYRQNMRVSVQGGYKYVTSENDDCAFYASLNWQGKAFKHFFSGSYFKALKGIDGGVGIGLGYRYDDAIVPNIELRYTKAILAFAYDVNVSSINASGVKRNGMEAAIRFDF